MQVIILEELLEAGCGLTRQEETPGASLLEGGTFSWIFPQGTPPGSRRESEKDLLVTLAGEGGNESF